MFLNHEYRLTGNIARAADRGVRSADAVRGHLLAFFDEISHAQDLVDGADQALVDITYDAETSGGLLITLPEAAGAKLEDELAQRDVPVHRIGEVVPRSGSTLVEHV